MTPKLSIGKKIRVSVKSIVPYGVFVNIGDDVGFIHISNLSWYKISDPNEIVKLKQKINVIVLSIDEDTKKIQVGLKQLKKNPWELINKVGVIGDIIKCKVISIERYGLLVKLQNGVEDIIDIKEIRWVNWALKENEQFDFIKKSFAIGNQIDAVITVLDIEKYEFELSIKRLIPDPSLKVSSKYAIGTTHFGIVKKISKYGAFINLGYYIDGLVHISELSWVTKYKHPSEILKEGDKLEVMVVENKDGHRKLNLSIKQLTLNPWDQFEIKYAVGTIHHNKIYETNIKGATIKLEENCMAYIQESDLKKSDGSILTESEFTNFEVIKIIKEFRLIKVVIAQ
jgi:small subunit ribosomal protein S1